MGFISYRDVTVDYGDCQPIRDLTLDLPMGATALIGPSGSGKSTLLRLLAGLQSPTMGTVQIDGKPVEKVSWRKAGDPRVALVRQDYRLVPFLSVADNICLAAEMRNAPCDPKDIDRVLEWVNLDPDLASRRPEQLSGGQQQRVAIARTLVTGASVVVADEPTGSLDAGNSEIISRLLVDLARLYGLAIIVATHDPSVAAAMDQVVDLEHRVGIGS